MSISEARLKRLISVALSCRMVNTEDWMDYLCAEINAALSDIGDSDRFEFKGSLIIKKGARENHEKAINSGH